MNILTLKEIEENLIRPRERVKLGEKRNPAEFYSCLNQIQRLEELLKYAKAIEEKDKQIELLKEENEKLNSVKDIIDNILYWDTCPKEYKEKLAKAFNITPKKETE